MVSLKKGQTEIIGLVVIVLIIIFVALFFLRFYLSSSNLDTKSVNSIKANNLINAIRLASVCNGNIGDAIISCCNNDDFCGQDACNFVNQEIGKIIKNSLDPKEQIFIEAKQNQEVCLVINNDCEGISSTANFIRNSEGEAEIDLKFCA